MTNTHPNPTRAALRDFASWDSGPVVSIFLPQDPTRTDLDPIQLKACAQWVEESLVRDHQQSHTDAEEMVAPLLDAASGTTRPGHGHAWFLSPHCSVSLPLHGFTDLVMEIGGVPDTLRLLPHLSTGPDYVVVAISQKHVRVFRANRTSIEALEVAGLPKSLDDALWYIRREPTFERHGSGAMHMAGGGQDFRKSDLHQYLHLVDKALCTALAGTHAPLVVMAVGYEASMFINESHYRHIVHLPITGNPDNIDPQIIHERSWAIMSAQAGPAEEAVARARRLAGTGMTVSDTDEIVRVAHAGAVDLFLVARSLTNTGAYRGALDAVREQLATALNLAMANGAAAHVVADVDLPDGSLATAVLRY